MGEGHKGLKLFSRLSKEELITLFKSYRGNISKIAEHIKCSRSTLMKHLNEDDELKDALHESRYAFVNEMLIDAENVLVSCIKDIKDKPNALKAAFFILNNQGKKLGYNQIGTDAESGTKVAGTLTLIDSVKLKDDSDDAS